ncbi:putative hydrolase YxeP [Corynebacterium capitovis DSM 44611]|uniref:amidohydrolase n=1 Tax=Corynebacterium capitovis TaxID=131081 RepID=UPI00035D7A18|nr:amidohydrolase [Corynebacterium capitovis]WKD56974.1 putative hydrolase YxeP [Corynebacterium capitovis DSM 44611]
MGIAADVTRWLENHHDTVIGWRRHIHSHPELSNEETATTRFLSDVLSAHGLNPVPFPGTGLYVDLGPEGGDRLAFRADIDALKVPELTGLDFASTTPGVSHACGHDIHTTVALALACALSETTLPYGVRIIFQPAEEVMGSGAVDVIEWGGLNNVAAIYALHVEPTLRVGHIGVRTGAITSAADVLRLDISGPGGHTSRPHITADVVYALGSVITQLPALLSRRVDPRTGTVLVFGQVQSGYAANAIPRSGMVRGTIRTADIATWRALEGLLTELIGQIIAPTGCDFTLHYQRGVPPVLNDDVATALIVEAGRSIDPHAVVAAPQSSGGEDFSWYLEQVPGSMVRLGAWPGKGEKQDLHRGDLCVDERSIGVGVRLFGALVERYFTAVAADDS